MDENFERDGGIAKLFQFSKTNLPGEHRPIQPELLCKGQPLRRGNRHLRGSVQFHVRCDAFGHRRQAEVLDDDRIDP